MIKFKSFLSGGIAPERKAQKPKARGLWAACFGLAGIFAVVAAQAKGPASFGFSLGPGSKPIAVVDKKDRDKDRDFVTPTVFQAAGPNAASIQSSVDAFRAALGNPSNGNAGPLLTGHREINWDGAPPNDATTAPVTPFNVFLNTRGSQFTTPGIGLSQAPPSGGPQGGLAVLFNKATYGTTFKAFSPSRLFTPVGSNITNALFFLPGSNGTVRATVTGFGAVFSDVDQPDGTGPGKRHEREEGEREGEERRGNRRASTLVEFFDADGELLFRSFVPASPGDGGFSFFGIKFNDARIASVRIKTGDVAPGPDDDNKNDIVMMDDFIYGEPKALP